METLNALLAVSTGSRILFGLFLKDDAANTDIDGRYMEAAGCLYAAGNPLLDCPRHIRDGIAILNQHSHVHCDALLLHLQTNPPAQILLSKMP